MELLNIRDTKIILRKLLKYRRILENTEDSEDAREILSIEILEDINKLIGIDYITNNIKFNELIAKNKENRSTFKEVWEEALKIIYTKEE